MSEHAHRHTELEAGSAEHLLTDPVCGMRVEAGSRYRYAFEGREFVFCSERCRDRFKATPAEYVNKVADSDAPTQTEHSHGRAHSAIAKQDEASLTRANSTEQSAGTPV